MSTTAPGAVARHYLMCPPSYFTVSYEINPWMHADLPTSTATAVQQWERLRDVYLDLGHQVDLIDPAPGLPDMVYAANGATIVDGICYSAQFRYPQRAPEGPLYEKWFADHGFITHTAEFVNEGEGDILMIGDVLAAGTGFRTTTAAHRELSDVVGREVISLELVDARFYHLDTALAVLSSDPADPQIAYYPPAFSPASQEVLRSRFPDALLVTEADATVLGLNAVSDGQHVIITPAATNFDAQLRERGYEPIPVATTELLKGGGGAKCCTLEVRPAPVQENRTAP